MNERAKAILNFWFKESSSEEHFKRSDEFDAKIRNQFENDYKKAINNELDGWQDNPKECLALVVLLDQFSRNLYRNNSQAFEQDNKTRLIVNEAVDRGYLEDLDQEKIHFLLMPLIHSEDISDHIFVHQLLESYLKNHKGYKQIKKAWKDHTIPIKKFGRYPHRNSTLNRKSTPEEKEFLKQPNSSW